MEPNRKILSPALALSCIKTEKFKTEMLSVSILSPIDRISSPRALLALSTLKRGTERYPSQRALDRRLGELYSTSVSIRCHKVGNCHLLGFCADMLGKEYTDDKTDVFGGTVELLCQLLFHPLTDESGCFLPAYMESEKNTQCDNIAAAINNPRAYAAGRLRDILYEGDPYGVHLLGDIESVRATTPEQLRDCYHKLIDENRFEVFYVGSRDRDEVEEVLRRELLPALGDRPRSKPSQHPLPLEAREIRRVSEEMPLAQGKLAMGFSCGVHIGDADYYAMRVMNELYGRSPISKLFVNVREKLSLCYYCSSSYDSFKGTITVSSGIASENREMAESEIVKQLQTIADGQVTDVEFEAAKRSILNSCRSTLDSPSALEGYYLMREELGINCSLERFADEIGRVSLSDVIRVASKVRLDCVYFLNGNGEEGEDGAE